MMFKVRDIMTQDVVSVSPQSTIREAMEALTINHLSGAPVVSGETVVGVISMTDIVGFIVGAPEHSQNQEQDSLIVSMDGNDDEFNEDEEEVQLLSQSEEVWDDWTRADNGVADAFPERTSLLDQQRVEEIMNDAVFNISPDASIKAAATMMRKHAIHRVLVMEGKSLAGIISSMDIARAVSERGISGRKTE